MSTPARSEPLIAAIRQPRSVLTLLRNQLSVSWSMSLVSVACNYLSLVINCIKWKTRSSKKLVSANPFSFRFSCS